MVVIVVSPRQVASLHSGQLWFGENFETSVAVVYINGGGRNRVGDAAGSKVGISVTVHVTPSQGAGFHRRDQVFNSGQRAGVVSKQVEALFAVGVVSGSGQIEVTIAIHVCERQITILQALEFETSVFQASGSVVCQQHRA